MMVTLDGYFEGENHDISWHNIDKDFEAFVDEQDGNVDTILFGKKTYQMMADFWPKPEALQSSPKTATFMNETKKFVASHELFRPEWRNTELLHENVFEKIKAMKEESGKDIAIFGSNNLCVSLIEQGLVDEFRIMINPIALGKGNPLFTGLGKKMNVKLVSVKEFQNGNVLHCYQPGAK